MKLFFRTIRILLNFILVLVCVFSLFGIWIFYKIPSRSEIKGCLTTKMYQVQLCPGSKQYVPYKQIPLITIRALLAAEDSKFFDHRGFDWEAIFKAYEAGKKSGKFKKGASTISQQLAKNMFLTKERTWFRKGLEALITVKIESTLTKQEILERYFNVVEFGKNLYGIKNAAQKYFQKTPSQLNAAESAFLIMLLPNPIKYAQSFHRQKLSPFAKLRIRRILNDLYKNGSLNEVHYRSALDQYATLFGPDLDIITEVEIEKAEQQAEEDLEQSDGVDVGNDSPGDSSVNEDVQ